MQSDDLGLVARLRGEIEFVQGDAAAWGVDAYGDLPRTLALLSEAAAALEAKDAAIERLVAERDEALAEWANTTSALDSMHQNRDAIQRHYNECTVRAEAAEAQRDKLKEALTLADAAIDLGLDLISDRKGWGKYQRMEGVEIYEDADNFEKAAEAYRARQALGDT